MDERVYAFTGNEVRTAYWIGVLSGIGVGLLLAVALRAFIGG